MRHFYSLDPSGRSLHWVMIHEAMTKTGSYAHRLKKVDLEVSEPRIRLSPHKGQDDMTDRPRFMEELVFLELTDPVNDWLVGAQYEYQPEFRWHQGRVGVCVGFRDKAQAAHFKLAWGL